MDAFLPWFGVSVCVAGLVAAWLILFAASRTRVELSNEEQGRLDQHAADIQSRTTPVLVVSGILGVLGVAAAAPGAAPFSPGMKLGIGFAVGIIIGMLMGKFAEWAHLVVARWSLRAPDDVPHGDILPSFAGGAGLCFLALAGVRLAMLVPAPKSRDEWIAPLLGYAIGLAVVCLVAVLNATAGHRASMFSALVACCVAATTILAIKHHFGHAVRHAAWPWLPMSVAAIAVLGGLLGLKIGLTMPFRLTARSAWVFGGVGSAALPILTALMMGVPMRGDTSVAKLGLIGVALGAVLVGHLFVYWSGKHSDTAIMQGTGMAVLAVVTVLVIAFKLEGGLAVGIVTLFAWSVAMPCAGGFFAEQLPPYSGWPGSHGQAHDPGESDPVTDGQGLPSPEMYPAAAVSHVAIGFGSLLTIPTLFLLYRVYIELFHSHVRDSGIAVTYTVIGMIVGAVLGVHLFASLLEASSKFAGIAVRSGYDGVQITAGFPGAGTRWLAGRSVHLLAPMAAAPAIAFFLWGGKACLGVVVGLWLVHIVATCAQNGLGTSLLMPQVIWSPADLSLAVVLATLLALPITQIGVAQGGLDRPTKVGLAIAVAVLLLVWRIAADLIDYARRQRGEV